MGAALSRRAACGIGCAFALVAPAVAMAQSSGVPVSDIVVVDRDALYRQSAFGQRVRADILEKSRVLQAENQRIAAELEAEEQALTAERDTLDIAAFSARARDFDARVEAIRAAQDAKTRAVTEQAERAQILFFEAATPILRDLARRSGALVVLDRRDVIAVADQIDITGLALAQVDATLGTGLEVLPNLSFESPAPQ